jgi:hypothetical protein
MYIPRNWKFGSALQNFRISEEGVNAQTPLGTPIAGYMLSNVVTVSEPRI